MPRMPQRLCRATLCLLLWLWQLVELAPISYCRRRGSYSTSLLLTASAALKLAALLIVVTPLFRLSMALYGATNVAHTSLFNRIAMLTLAADLSISLALLATHLWQRQRLANLLNSLARLRRVHLGWPHLLLLWTKLLLSVYELLCNVPFFRRTAGRLPWPQLLAYGSQLYLQHLSSIYANGLFAVLLLLLAGLQQLERQWQQSEVSQRQLLLRREWRLLRICADFVACFQLGIFLLLIGNFLNILANMYAMLDYFVSQHGVPLTMSNYCLIVTLELYALVLVAHLCQARHRRVRQCCLEQCYINEEQAMAPTPLLVWPLSTLKLSVLGIFVLDNTFWLFLVSYAVNFIVIILQFTLDNMKR